MNVIEPVYWFWLAVLGIGVSLLQFSKIADPGPFYSHSEKKTFSFLVCRFFHGFALNQNTQHNTKHTHTHNDKRLSKKIYEQKLCLFEGVFKLFTASSA